MRPGQNGRDIEDDILTGIFVLEKSEGYFNFAAFMLQGLLTVCQQSFQQWLGARGGW